MKKIIAFAISLIMMLSGSMIPVFADQQNAITNVVITPNATNNQIVVQGNISTGNGKNVTIQVLDPNGYLEYLGQTTSTEGGGFTFTFKSNSGAKGIYTVKIGGEGISAPYEKTFEFSGAVVTPSEISNVTVTAVTTTAEITVQGNISAGSGKNVTIQVLDPDGVVDYVGQTVSVDGGKFAFTFAASSVLEGSYTAKIGGEGVKTPYQQTFQFSNSSSDQKPSVPTNLKAVAGTNEIDLTWTAVTGATGYNVYRATTADGLYTKINSNPVTTASYSDKGLSEKTTYYYKVTAVNAVEESDMSASVPATTGAVIINPAVISNVELNTDITTGNVVVKGKIITGSGKNVTIQVLAPKGGIDYIGQTISTDDGKFVFTFRTNSVEDGDYLLKIGGEGIVIPYQQNFEFSNTSTDEKPSVPTDLKALVKGVNEIDLTWTAATGVAGYNVYRATTADGEYTKVNNSLVTTTSYSDTGLSAKTAYYYKVTAVNTVGESDKSASVTATTEEMQVAPVVTKDQLKIDDATTGSEIQIPSSITTGDGIIPISVDAVQALQQKDIKVRFNIGSDVVFGIPASAIDLSGIDGVQNPSVQIAKRSVAKEDVTTSSTFRLIGNAYEFTMAIVDGASGKHVKDVHSFAGKKVAVTINLNIGDLVGVDTSRLKAYFFNTATNAWEEIGMGVFNSQTNTFTFDTTHFTQFAIMEDKSTTTSNGGSSSGGSSTTVTTATSKRLAGLNRIDTSIAIAKEQFSDKQPDAVVLTSGTDFPDALGGSGLAYKENAPVLLVGKSVDDSKNVLDYITSNLDKNKNIYVLGGTGAVSTEISEYLIAQGYNVIRLGGSDRYETNQKIVDSLNVAKGTPIVIANGNYFADALSISSIADMKGYPVLINAQDSLSANVIKDITNIQPTTVYVIGGTGVLSANIETQIKNLNGNTNIVRLGGKDRYETSMMIIEKFNLNTNTVTVASGENFPDALSGSVLAARKNSNVLLINNSDVSRQKELLKKQKITNVIVLGGEGVVNKDTVNSLVQK